MRGTGGAAARRPEDHLAGGTGALERLRSVFFASPYRPTGLSTSQRAIVRLVDKVLWLGVILDRQDPGAAAPCGSVGELERRAGVLLDHAAKALGPGRSPDDDLDQHRADLAAARTELEEHLTTPGHFPLHQADLGPREPSFRAHELSFAVSDVAEDVAVALSAERRTWWQRLLGRAPIGFGAGAVSARQRAGSHVEWHSVWLHNSVRGAVALALAVLIADLTGVQHSFWVVLGTISVLRTNALSTGQTALRGLIGTAIGFAVGAALVLALGVASPTLWIVFPVAVLIAGVAPAVSFAAGQAGFTVTLLVLFNILAPAGWQVGLVRIEDVAIGFAVSLLVGALFWPRGAVAALAQELAEAYSAASHYLEVVVQFATAAHGAPSPSLVEARRRADAAARRLDDALREFLAEQGAKHLSLAQIAELTTGVAGLRLISTAVLELWRAPAADDAVAPDVRTALRRDARRICDWYDTLAQALAGWGEVGDAVPDRGDVRTVAAVVHARLTGADPIARDNALRAVWTADHLEAARLLQSSVVGPARQAATYRHHRAAAMSWWFGRAARRPERMPLPV